MYPTITKVEYLGDYRLRLSFDTGEAGDVDLEEFISRAKGMILPLKDKSYFAQVSIGEESGTIVWPNGADLDPIVLYEDATKKILV